MASPNSSSSKESWSLVQSQTPTHSHALEALQLQSEGLTPYPPKRGHTHTHTHPNPIPPPHTHPPPKPPTAPSQPPTRSSMIKGEPPCTWHPKCFTHFPSPRASRRSSFLASFYREENRGRETRHTQGHPTGAG